MSRRQGDYFDNNNGVNDVVDFYNYTCEKCGYTAMVSGKNVKGDFDEGMTILCEDCKELHEIEPESAFTVKRSSHRMLRCPESFTHKIRVWSYPGACPRCGQPMKKGDHVVSWD